MYFSDSATANVHKRNALPCNCFLQISYCHQRYKAVIITEPEVISKMIFIKKEVFLKIQQICWIKSINESIYYALTPGAH